MCSKFLRYVRKKPWSYTKKSEKQRKQKYKLVAPKHFEIQNGGKIALIKNMQYDIQKPKIGKMEFFYQLLINIKYLKQIHNYFLIKNEENERYAL